VDTTLDDAPLIAPERFLQVRYEDFIARPADILGQIAGFAGLSLPPGYLQTLPPIRSGNRGKWRAALSPDDQQKVARVIAPTLERLGYTLDEE
jgi:hypothetical protein